ncbi:T9SS type A sorting domain-containing protein [Mangrovimonas cancribranchiae]|uniref:T9SS type A sorting domain-containing protein n=1 Tax=Mangrovimonas cancribranchiae TaxID=3080055 RepID=A0AAU6P2Z2_9FLAO
MKKITLFFAMIIALNSYMLAQTTAIPDPNFEQALIDFNIDSDNTLNGQMPTVDANSYTGTLSVPNEGITDLTGIEDFTNITGLNIQYNAGITSLDVTSNTNLTLLNAEGCTSLSTLNIANLTALADINIAGCPVSSLDLSTNTGLAILNVRFMGISELDLSSNVSLVSLDARNNSLVVIDMRNGNNANVTNFRGDFNPGPCIMVDDVTEPNLTTWTIDASSNFYENDIDCPTLSVEEAIKETAFNIYPNPVNNNLFVTIDNAKGSVAVYNITGKQVLRKDLQKGTNTLNMTQLSSGVYLVRIQTADVVETKKLIVQ